MDNVCLAFLSQQDPDIADAIDGEHRRQAEGLELIPSENYVSRAVREALASELTNKYSEGYPGKRYYGGQEFTDAVERLAIERARQLFGARFVNVQPLSGAPANLAAYMALLEPGDTVLGMNLAHGGHLTHGHPLTLPAKIYRFVNYGVTDRDSAEIDYDALRDLALRERPKLILAGFSAYPKHLQWKRFKEIADEVGAYTMADVAHIAGLIVAGVEENPLAAGFDVVTTTTHKTLRGPRGGLILTNREDIAAVVDKAVFPGVQGGPHMNNIAAKAVAFLEAQHPMFRDYARQIVANARAMAEVFAAEGVRMVGGGTENHLILVDAMTSFGVGGKEAQDLLDDAGITLNKNAVPFDERKPMDPSGIRLGTPAMTTRGMREKEARQVAQWIIAVLRAPQDAQVRKKVREEVRALCAQFPIPERFVPAV
ncbi:serine hydroxymethyltransferase [Candidatus Parcubacteria bacterium]|nr:MAG: serine hydroxymethyltransferase [Candidatus Parcubacteria bacterium]